MKRHIKPISLAATEAKQDELGFIFLQIWLSVFTAMLTGAFGSKR